ncbi:MAG: hypothetical protein U0Q16_19635 [Bryobacteraceae bacterium]
MTPRSLTPELAASLMLDAISRGDSFSLRCARSTASGLRSAAISDTAFGERVELLEEIAADLESAPPSSAHIDLLRHLASPLLRQSAVPL